MVMTRRNVIGSFFSAILVGSFPAKLATDKPVAKYYRGRVDNLLLPLMKDDTGWNIMHPNNRDCFVPTRDVAKVFSEEGQPFKQYKDGLDEFLTESVEEHYLEVVSKEEAVKGFMVSDEVDDRWQDVKAF